jgi:DNA-binding response OmpR family regulator
MVAQEARSAMANNADQSTILIVDDDVDTADFFAELLEMEGYQTRIAGSGRAALAALAERPVQLVLLDHRLPDMNGLEVCRQIRYAGDLRLPILLVTADSSQALEMTARAAGASAYLPKPMRNADLLDQIAALLDSVRGAPPA